MDEIDVLKLKLENLPLSPGVYIFRDQAGSILYIGKAKRLKNRVRSYFQESRNLDGRIRTMVSHVAALETIVTDSEAEALILEHNLIKENGPRYNIMYRDDKTYPYICVTNEFRPRIFPTRTPIKDGSSYFGPYDSVVSMKRMLEMIASAFDLCSCACSIKTIDRNRPPRKWRSCFSDYLDGCSEDIPIDIYRDSIRKITRLLNGKTESLIRELREEMEIAAQALAFEQAAKLRDGLEALSRYSQKMKMVSGDLKDRDIFAVDIELEENVACGVLLKLREGKVVGRYHRYLKNIEGRSATDILTTFVEDYYTSPLVSTVPDEVFLSHELEEPEPLEQFLWQQHGEKVPLLIPKIGEKAQLVGMALANGRHKLREWKVQKMKGETDRIPHSVKSLQRDLRLARLPRRIECFDNSNFQGSDPVASMVCFVDGQPRKSEYKRFQIKTVVGPDDFASMKEILTRRYGRLMKEGGHLPDLIVVDGGKGQLSSAVEALKEIDFFGQAPIIGLAKRLEEVFEPEHSEPVMIPRTSSSLKLLQRVRDEAHRFAITYHRQKRSKRTIQSELEQIQGIGKATTKKILGHFGSVKQVKESGLEELSQIVGQKTAEHIRAFFDTKEAGNVKQKGVQ